MSTQLPPPSVRRKRLGELLISAGVLNEGQLMTALTEQKKWGGKLGRTLVELGFVDEETMVLALARQLKLPLINLEQQKLDDGVTTLLRVDLAEQYGVFPLGVQLGTRILQLATSDPTHVEAIAELSRKTGYRIQPVVASLRGIENAIRRYYYGEPSTSVSPLPPSSEQEAQTPSENLLESRNTPLVSYSSVDSSLAVRLAQMAEQLDTIEQVLLGQVKALKGLIDLLSETGVISREAYLAKVKDKQ